MTPEALGRRAEAMLTELGAISDEPGRLTRLYLGPAHARAVHLVSRWMEQSGLAVRVDAAGTVHGLWSPPGGAAGRPRLLVGSHIDTVVDAGRYDGALGVIAGILAAEEIQARAMDPPFAVEVLALGDEEGVRFPHTLTSSRAIAGSFDAAALDERDGDGTTLRAALAAFGADPAAIAGEVYRQQDVAGYLEVHIEQGPVLEAAGEPLAVVSAIAGQTRWRVRVAGEAGHAGTVPMALRRDALAAAAEMVVAAETAAAAVSGAPSLVATVGMLSPHPGAANVIPGAVDFSLDVRAADDAVRHDRTRAIRDTFEAIAQRRKVGVTVETVHDQPVTLTAPRLQSAIADAIGKIVGRAPRTMMSGAGHDGQAMAHLTDIGMIFVRCRGGFSHNPAEYASPDDMGLAIAALVETVATLATTDVPQGDTLRRRLPGDGS